MSERELDSSINDYIETETPKNYVKQQEWDMAIGLQEVDNLKPSKYLEKLLQENVTGEKTIYEVEHELKQYYVEKDKTDKTIQDEFECDLVSIIDELHNMGITVYGTDVNNGIDARELSSLDKTSFALVMGNEGNGVRREVKELCDKNLYINMNENVESLNVGVATSILLYELGR